MEKKKKTGRSGEDPSAPEESLEQLIEKRKTVADAYRKILHSLESKLRKDK
jgi:hypothetical protein